MSVSIKIINHYFRVVVVVLMMMIEEVVREYKVDLVGLGALEHLLI